MEKNRVRKFVFHWLDNTTTEGCSLLQGSREIAAMDAFGKAGYGLGALRALDYWEEIKNEGENGSEKQDG